jgi:hypothetical protein
MPREGFLRKQEKSSGAFAEDVAFTTPETDGGAVQNPENDSEE